LSTNERSTYRYTNDDLSTDNNVTEDEHGDHANVDKNNGCDDTSTNPNPNPETSDCAGTKINSDNDVNTNNGTNTYAISNTGSETIVDYDNINNHTTTTGKEAIVYDTDTISDVTDPNHTDKENRANLKSGGRQSATSPGTVFKKNSVKETVARYNQLILGLLEFCVLEIINAF
jgi:archaellum component FlaG (FlaF/FlaG flagellin family)